MLVFVRGGVEKQCGAPPSALHAIIILIIAGALFFTGAVHILHNGCVRGARAIIIGVYTTIDLFCDATYVVGGRAGVDATHCGVRLV